MVESNPSLVTPRLTRYIPHRPTPKQAAFLLLPHLEAFYGGAASGGKSDALLMGALQYVDVPGYAALLLRRTYQDLALPGALMERAQEWLRPTDAHWDDTEKTWKFPSGATLTFGYLAAENDKYRYQSSEFQFIGFDELTQFSETQYRYLFSRLRRLTGVGTPIRMRGASNPGGIGHDWVQRRFNIHKDHGLLRGGIDGRIFIPALKDDNPHIDQAEYSKALSQLDHITRAQLAEGDWTVRPSGGKFKVEWFEIVDVVPADCLFVRYWDLAATAAKDGTDPDWTAGVKVGISQGRYYVIDVARVRARPGEVERLIRFTADRDGVATTCYMEQEPGSAGVQVIDHYRRTVLQGYAFYENKTTGSKEIRANPVSAQAEAGNIKILRGAWNQDFLDELAAFPQGSHDDQVDALSGACEQLAKLQPSAVEAIENYEYTISGGQPY